MDTVRGQQGLAKSQQDVTDVSIRFAAPDQESRRDERFPCECGIHGHMWVVDELRRHHFPYTVFDYFAGDSDSFQFNATARYARREATTAVYPALLRATRRQLRDLAQSVEAIVLG